VSQLIAPTCSPDPTACIALPVPATQERSSWSASACCKHVTDLFLPSVCRGRTQISAISSPFEETSDLFETGSVRGLPEAAVRRLPETVVAEDGAVDAAGQALCCSVCLQDFRVGDRARRLPGCRHLFHVPCIDCWLLRHGSCPLCRRDI
jgi:hypothetical protein